MNKNNSLVYRNPITPSQRHVRLLNRKDLIKIPPLKAKTFYLKNKAGRNNQGKLTIFTKGGAIKKYRQISFNRPFQKVLLNLLNTILIALQILLEFFVKIQRTFLYFSS